MPAFASLSLGSTKKEAKGQEAEMIEWALAAYAVSTLVAMAPMNIGAAVLFGAVVLSLKGQLWKKFKDEWKRPESRLYLSSVILLSGACAISLVAARFFPLVYLGRISEVHFLSDMA